MNPPLPKILVLINMLGSPGTNLAGSSNLAGSLPHELVINLGKVESNMASIL